MFAALANSSLVTSSSMPPVTFFPMLVNTIAGLGQHRPANKSANLDAQRCHSWDHGVAYDMAKDDTSRRQSLGARGHHELARHGFHDAGRQEARQHRRGSHAQGDERQGHGTQVLHRVSGKRHVATRRKPSQLDCYNDLQQ